ncbi:cleavage and polyadenylation specificity factor subunit 4 [Rhizophagus clarus]|uniref:mRNA 3'-end-processing protein n=1 Tax=Rhizophagus clarus TaxID=94130 RepID=A0A8H3L3V6_9GLOM|nr:cleavage and polyadenylation specificity factor subunit 4 [Rhizophagus clarus]
MTKHSNEVCQDFLRGICKRTNCKYQHKIRKFVVCKYWLRGLCMKGEEQCEYLHEYNLSKMPKCAYYKLYGVCNLTNCIYSHDKVKSGRCNWYDRGFCRKGLKCNKKHVKQVVCQLYLTGFCPRGPSCPNGHPKMDLIGKHREFSFFNKNLYDKMMAIIEEGGDDFILNQLTETDKVDTPYWEKAVVTNHIFFDYTEGRNTP